VQTRKADGFALIDMIFVCGIVGLLCSIALPRLALAKQSAGAASAIGSMRTMNSAQLTYALTCGSGFYAPSLTALGTAPPGSTEGFIGGGLGSADTVIKSAYIIRMTATAYALAPDTCNQIGVGTAGQSFIGAADPAENVGSPRFFATNANNVVYEHTSTLFGVMPETGVPPIGTVLGR